MFAFIIISLVAYAGSIGVALLVNVAALGFEGFAPWPLAWFLWSVACWPGLAAGVIARWTHGAPPRVLIWLHAANALLVLTMIELSFLLSSDTPLYITILMEIVLVYAAIARAKK